MFTGLIESICEVFVDREASRLDVALGDMAHDVKRGESIAINGTCLTVTCLTDDKAGFDVSPETLACTTLGQLRTGDTVNVERALAVGQRLGGHFVQGHVDGRATLRLIRQQGEFWTLSYDVEENLRSQLVPKGSVAVDGVSLTVAALDAQGFSVAIIPETAAQTTLCQKKQGDTVNIEVDMLVKAVHRACGAWMEQHPALTVETLKKAGF